VPLPISRNQLNKLGQRLAASDQPSDEYLALLGDVQLAYKRILNGVERVLLENGFFPTTRVKTNGTLIDKLKRVHGLVLGRVQDVAGARINGTGGLEWQDTTVAKICEIFEKISQKAVRVVDRRLLPSHGYRAVHVVVFPEDVPVEIQVRTYLQNEWAQFVERLADAWGRGLRYGQAEDLQGEVIETSPDDQHVTRFDILEKVLEVSDLFYRGESDLREFKSAAEGQTADWYFRGREELLKDMLIVLGVVAARQKDRSL
jgi:ppGpp synthetase/RelA/SpoT-type nucleotidyltranferase